MAEMVSTLIESGHTFSDVCEYNLTQVEGFFSLAHTALMSKYALVCQMFRCVQLGDDESFKDMIQNLEPEDY